MVDEKQLSAAEIKDLQAQLKGANKALAEAGEAKKNAEAELKLVKEANSLKKGKHQHAIRNYEGVNYQKPWFEVCGQIAVGNRKVAAEGEVLARRSGLKVLFKGGIGISNSRTASVELATTLHKVYIVEHAPLCKKCNKEMEEDIIAREWFCNDNCDGVKNISMKGYKR